MLELSHYASSDEEEEEQNHTHTVPQVVTALAVALDTAKDRQGAPISQQPHQHQQPHQQPYPDQRQHQHHQSRLIDSLPTLRTYPASPLDARWAALQQPAINALKAKLWTPQTPQEYIMSSHAQADMAAETRSFARN